MLLASAFCFCDTQTQDEHSLSHARSLLEDAMVMEDACRDACLRLSPLPLCPAHRAHIPVADPSPYPTATRQVETGKCLNNKSGGVLSG